MKQKIGRFEFDMSDTVSILNYNRTFKDWFDILSSLLIVLLSSLVIVFLFLERIEKFDWVYICIIALLCFIIFLKGSYAIGRLLEPSKELIKIEKDKKLIKIQLTRFKKVTFKISELKLINYHLNTDTVVHSDSDSATLLKNRFWIEIELMTKNRESIKVLNINPSHFFQKNDLETRQELLNRSKILIKQLSIELGIESRFQQSKEP